jgi:hypothetical protein
MSYPEQMYRAYVDCALWSSHDTDDDGTMHESFQTEGYSIKDLAPETAAEMRAEVADFYKANRAKLLDLGIPPAQAGTDFWLARNRYCESFSDHGYGEPGDKLQRAARTWGSYTLMLQRDGKIHGS